MIKQFLKWIERVGDRRAILTVAVATFLLQVAFLRSPEIFGEPYTVAKNIVAGRGFVFTYPDTPRDAVTCYVTPLYTYLQVPFLASGLGERGIQIFNLLLLQCATFFLYRFLRRFLPQGIALLGYTALSIYVPLWILGYALEPNTLNMLLLVLTIDRLYVLAGDPTLRRWVELGILTGLQLLVRPDILIGAACFAVWMIWRSSSKIQTAGGLAMSGLIALAIVAPWTIRNYVTFDRFILVSANSGFNLYIGNNPAASGELDSRLTDPEATALAARIREYGLTHDQVEVDSYRRSLALEWAFQHPVRTTLLDLKKLMYHWIGRSDLGTQYHIPQRELAVAYVLVSVVMMIIGGYGLFSLADSRARTLLIALFAYSSLVSMIFFVQSRHRALKVDPFLVPLSVYGVVLMTRRRLSADEAPYSTAPQQPTHQLVAAE